MEKEIWKEVKGFENYLVSNLGNVKTKAGRLKAINYGSCGYGYLELWSKNKSKHFRVHRLVAQHFLDNSDNLPQVNHKDGDKKNNKLSNLEWCSAKENIRHAIDNDLSSIKYGSRNLASKLKEEDVLFIRANAKTTHTVRELSKMFKVSTTNIYNILANKKWVKV